jgi:hypothetical protein
MVADHSYRGSGQHVYAVRSVTIRTELLRTSKSGLKEAEPLWIDRAAAAELPSAQAVPEWAREKRAFISSVIPELAAELQAAAAGVRTVGLRAVMFEEFGGRDADPEEAYLAEVEGSDICVGGSVRSTSPLRTVSFLFLHSLTKTIQQFRVVR